MFLTTLPPLHYTCCPTSEVPEKHQLQEYCHVQNKTNLPSLRNSPEPDQGQLACSTIDFLL